MRTKLQPKNTKEKLEDLQKLREIITLDTLKNNVKFISSKFSTDKEVDIMDIKKNSSEPLTLPIDEQKQDAEDDGEKRGTLTCEGKQTDSEVIYWKIVEKDKDFESPITPHHGIHNDRYITFEYDHGGWNNARIGMECLIVVAHAMGRTIVIPPQQHLYLLGI